MRYPDSVYHLTGQDTQYLLLSLPSIFFSNFLSAHITLFPGISKGLMIRIGAVLMRTIPYLTTQLGLPDWAGYILIILIVTGTILVGTFIGVYISITHEKAD